MEGGVPGGTPGGQPGGVLGGVPGGVGDGSDGPFRLGGQVKEPRRIREVKPIYPEEARKARVEGVVILEIIVDKLGNVRDPQVLRPLPMGLTEAAIDAVRQWKYEPSTLDSRPVEVYMIVTVTFRLM
jgi:protein TonB